MARSPKKKRCVGKGSAVDVSEGAAHTFGTPQRVRDPRLKNSPYRVSASATESCGSENATAAHLTISSCADAEEELVHYDESGAGGGRKMKSPNSLKRRALTVSPCPDSERNVKAGASVVAAAAAAAASVSMSSTAALTGVNNLYRGPSSGSYHAHTSVPSRGVSSPSSVATPIQLQFHSVRGSSGTVGSDGSADRGSASRGSGSGGGRRRVRRTRRVRDGGFRGFRGAPERRYGDDGGGPNHSRSLESASRSIDLVSPPINQDGASRIQKEESGTPSARVIDLASSVFNGSAIDVEQGTPAAPVGNNGAIASASPGATTRHVDDGNASVSVTNAAAASSDVVEADVIDAEREEKKEKGGVGNIRRCRTVGIAASTRRQQEKKEKGGAGKNRPRKRRAWQESLRWRTLVFVTSVPIERQGRQRRQRLQPSQRYRRSLTGIKPLFCHSPRQGR